MKKWLLFLLILAPVFVFAQAAMPAAAPAPDSDFLSQLVQVIKGFGGMTGLMKISSIILLVIASIKVSFLQPLWAKLGEAQVWAAPALGLLAGVLGIGSAGPWSWATVVAYLMAGGGAVYLHELLDSLKALPGLGSMYVSIIGLIEGLLGSPKPKAA